MRVTVDLQFVDSDGDIDIRLTDSSGQTLASSQSTTDNESIDYIVSSSGTYYLRVYFGNAGNHSEGRIHSKDRADRGGDPDPAIWQSKEQGQWSSRQG
jgi:hypothetical protein